MRRITIKALSVAWVAAASACGGAATTSAGPSPAATASPATSTAAAARPNRNRPPATEADIRFMTNMIPHHAQAVLFAGWAESHGASRAIQAFCERIVVGQRDEIATMRNWLEDHGQPVPPAEYMRMSDHMGHDMAGMGTMEHSMPGMLSEEQLAALDAARGPDFDRLFLEYMIGHHQGAIIMVDELFASYGGAQDDFVFKLANDIGADQTIEIERMQSMLEAMPQG